MQCKDIPDIDILLFLEQWDGIGWCHWFGNEYERSVTRAFPAETPSKLVLAKMAKLIRRGVIDGCPCGCRGDFRLNDKGRYIISALREKTC